MNEIFKTHLVNTIAALNEVMKKAVCADEIMKASAGIAQTMVLLKSIEDAEETEREAAIEQEKQEHDMAFVTMMLFHEDAE